MHPALARLRTRLGPAGWLDQPAAMAPYLEESRARHHGAALAVVRPADTAAVAAVLAACHEAGVGMVPQGGNTGRCAGALPTAGQLVLSLARLDRIRAVDALDGSLTAEAGCILADVQAAARAHGRLFPLSLGAEGSCTIGGNLATNAGGLNVLRYGSARALCLGLEVVLADGRVWDGLRRLRKDNTGYDLRDLFIGSEGTLGVITAAVLRLFPLPERRATALAALADLDACLALLARARHASADTLTSFELLPRIGLDAAVRHVPGCRDPFDVAHAWCVLLELDGAGDAPAARLEALLADALAAGEIVDAATAASEAQAAALWRLREGLVEAQRHEGASIKHDVAVPVSRVPEFIRQASAACTALLPGVRPYPFGHVGDGNVHFNLSQPPGMAAADFLACWGRCERVVHDLVAACGGSFSAEHGVGRSKTGEMARYKSPLELELMRGIKRTLDPRGILNPGAVLPPG
ncbi:4-phosphoerythronate dehydrogenase (FAD-dependent) [Plasticicumulans lactativorans]|uniref:4-phosphoerythronate dehydrogenase (FAD-dependent) n=1 Tax=Plasticicumulans lactativorans TaxID=1133106 RepID=A0A4R2LDT2_9GAMM|nr:FAD-binding oxidoreductase [Plasticicumulans lactativorans]TCO83792.1 4-phosphoerythronate dehydrogenase (FAD-dependent) [Plasticicumulans lactativorans]